jgi:hypothetical protein
MLEDAHKPLRIPGHKPRLPNTSPDIRIRSRAPQPTATRLANARDRTSIYALANDTNLSPAEKEAMRKQLQEKFTPAARPIAATVTGLQSLASQRIEDAIARGLFKNIPRGKGVNVERDHNADSPFIDTTEYFMNKIIKKQDLTPPWIEKQAELQRAAAVFRARLRSDWKRHAARAIASKGGTLDEQVARAKSYAQAEAHDNPPPKTKREILSSIDDSGNLTHVEIEENPASPDDEDADMKITIKETAASPETQSTNPPTPALQPSTSKPPSVPPFRDQSWLKTEQGYHTLAINQLNNLTRSYNLMAPELAKKPYFSLDRELRSCYAEVAPLLAEEILARAATPRVKVEIVGHRPGGVMERFGVTEKAKVFDDRRKAYGLKEFWRDLFAKDGN